MKLYSHITIIFIIWFLSVLFICIFGFLTLPHSNKFGNDFLTSFSNWDGGHFLGIAKNGYSEKFQYAFFPLYPLAINLLNRLINSYLLSAILISVISTFLGLHLLYQLMRVYFEKKLAEKIILALIFFPTSFYFLTAYSEGLFFLLVVSTFYFLGKRKLFLATIFATLASATRLVGLAVAVGLLVEVISTFGVKRKNWFIFLAPLGFFIYCWYLYTKTSDPFYFIAAEAHWQRSITVPVFSFWESIRSLSQPEFISTHFSAFLDLIFAVFGLGLSIRTFRFLPLPFSIYSILSILLPLFTPTLTSMPRFLLPIFPIFILIALNKNSFINLTYQVIAVMLLAIFSVLFVTGYWVS